MSELSQVLQKLETIETRLDQLDVYGKKMQKHIDFVEMVFSVVQRPLAALCDMFYGVKTRLLELKP
jgi:hypothetical protein